MDLVRGRKGGGGGGWGGREYSSEFFSGGSTASLRGKPEIRLLKQARLPPDQKTISTGL